MSCIQIQQNEVFCIFLCTILLRMIKSEDKTMSYTFKLVDFLLAKHAYFCSSLAVKSKALTWRLGSKW